MFSLASVFALFLVVTPNVVSYSFAGPPNLTSATQKHVEDEKLQEPGDSHHQGENPHDNHSITHQMMILVLQLALIVLAARLGGEICERFLKQPSVLGELVAGMVIGPYLLGPYLSIFGSGALFPILTDSVMPVSPELYGVATIASVILLFMVGLETDFYKFFRYAGPGFAVGVGGVVGSFLVGDLLYVWYSGDNFMSPSSLFMGTISTATSVGITARVLSEKKKLDSPEGTTILAGAVIDDVLGILILAVVGGIASLSQTGAETVDWGKIMVIALKAFGFWIVATLLGIAISSRLSRFMFAFKTEGSRVGLGFGFALLLAGIAEIFGLAMIIGAYIMGLALSKEEIAHRLQLRLRPVYACFVPIFFAVMGMLVNFEAMRSAFLFGILYTVTAIVAKILGGGLPALFVGFNKLGAARIGMGMLPRGEVALIVAGVGMSQGYIGADMFGVVIMMTLITTVIAPPALVWLFANPKPGHKKAAPISVEEPELEKMITIQSLTWVNHELLINCILAAFRAHSFSVNVLHADEGLYQMSGVLDNDHVKVSFHDGKDRIMLKTGVQHHSEIKEFIEEALVEVQRRINQLEVVEEDL